MTRIVTMLLAAFALWAAAPSASQAQNTHGCACLHNRVGQPINFRFRWGTNAFETRTLNPGMVFSFCWPYGAGIHTSPPLQFMLDRDMSGGTSWTNYGITRVQSPTTQCSGVPAMGHYHVAFQPNTNNQFLHVVKGAGVGVGVGPGPGPGPVAGNRFGCACINNGVGVPINFQYRWGNAAFQNRTLNPGMVYAFCWPYGAGLHTSPPLQFKLDRDMSQGRSYTNYAITRIQSPTNQCSGVPREGQYWVRYQPGTNNQFLHVAKQ